MYTAFWTAEIRRPASGKDYVEQLEDKMKEIGVGEIASVSGRYYAMDRDNRWDRVQKAYDALRSGVGETSENAVRAVADSYAKDITDEFMLPTVILKDGVPTGTVRDQDAVIFFNFLSGPGAGTDTGFLCR